MLWPTDRWGPSRQILANFKALVSEAGAEVVISSSHRLEGWAKLEALLVKQGFPGISGCTPVDVVSKSAAIIEHLSCRTGCHFVVIDDCDLDVPHLVRCQASVGLSREAVQAALIELKSQAESEQQT